MKRLSLAATLIGFGLLAACSSPVPEGESALEVSDAYIVMPAGGQGIASGGMVVTVRGGDEMLTAATTDAADSVEIHTMSMDDGVMRMRQVESLPVTEKAPLVLKRGGNHLMFFGFDKTLAVGDSADIVLTFSNGQGKEQMLVTKAEIIGQGD
ncbi:MAG: copper chaperone PCu(A)C [Hyphomonas sp.]|uniref:copper chaperone PCu(A)C n=1 Tax=Hyphomonas sp. TaxID=87 RepID=UPI003003213F